MVNGKVHHHLLCIHPTHEINQIGAYSCAVEFWEKLVELHEGIRGHVCQILAIPNHYFQNARKRNRDQAL